MEHSPARWSTVHPLVEREVWDTCSLVEGGDSCCLMGKPATFCSESSPRHPRSEFRAVT